MPAEAVVDASIIGGAFFNEAGSDRTRAYLSASPRLIAPDLLRLEVASLAGKKVRRREAGLHVGRRALRALPEFVSEFFGLTELSERAFTLAVEHGVSVYDGCYLALAEQRVTTVVTLDERLIRRATDQGLGHLVALPN